MGSAGGNSSYGNVSSSSELGRGQSQTSAGSRGLVSAGSDMGGELQNNEEEEDKEAQVINSRGTTSNAGGSK